MAQKTRNQLETVVNNNIYDNNNKEILASMVREVLKDYRDSYFNLLDDELQNLKYNSSNTLSQVLASVNTPPLWGSTGSFNLSSNGATISQHSDPGIIQSSQYITLGSQDARIVMTLTTYGATNITGRKIMVQIVGENYTNADNDNDIATPVVYLSGNQIHVSLRELSGNPQNIRIEVFAFQVNKG